METVFEKYFAELSDARRACAAKNEEMKQKYNCYFCCSVWDARNSNVWQNGVWMKYLVTGVIWPNQIIK